MVDIAAAVKEFPGVRPVAGLDGCWTWSDPGFHTTVALTADGGHALQLNNRDDLDLALVVAVLAFARERTEDVLAAAPFAILEGFTSPSATPFDTVAAAIPAVHRYLEYKAPELNEVTYAVFPAYRCEFSGLENQEEAIDRFDDMIDLVDLRRPPSPWVRMRFDNPRTGAGSIGPRLGLASVDILMQELSNLENADNAFVEFENFRNERRHVFWSDGVRLSHGDQIRTMGMAELLAWAHRFVYEGVDSAA